MSEPKTISFVATADLERLVKQWAVQEACRGCKMDAYPVTRLFWLVAAVMAIALSSFALSYAALVRLAAANGLVGWLTFHSVCDAPILN